eukprot:Polyplicarium_translucidae@DN3185_c0_g1_i3.p1
MTDHDGDAVVLVEPAPLPSAGSRCSRAADPGLREQSTDGLATGRAKTRTRERKYLGAFAQVLFRSRAERFDKLSVRGQPRLSEVGEHGGGKRGRHLRQLRLLLRREQGSTREPVRDAIEVSAEVVYSQIVLLQVESPAGDTSSLRTIEEGKRRTVGHDDRGPRVLGRSTSSPQGAPTPVSEASVTRMIWPCGVGAASRMLSESASMTERKADSCSGVHRQGTPFRS